MKVRAQRLFSAVIASAALIILFTCPSSAKQGIADGLSLCAEVVIPSLFPFMAAAGFIARSGASRVLAYPLRPLLCPLFDIPGEACFTVMMSFIGGYPVGAAGVERLYRAGVIDRKTASSMLTFCVNAGPAMAVSAVGGGMLGSYKVGWVLYASNAAAALMTGAVFSLAGRDKKRPGRSSIPAQSESAAQAFVGAVSDSCAQMLTVCGYVVLFACIVALLRQCSAENAAIAAEVTSGARRAVEMGLSAPFVSAVIGFGGLSVICQTISLSHGLISTGKLILSRLVNAGASYLICSLLIKLVHCPAGVMSNLGGVGTAATYAAAPLSVSMLVMAAALLSSCSAKN